MVSIRAPQLALAAAGLALVLASIAYVVNKDRATTRSLPPKATQCCGGSTKTGCCSAPTSDEFKPVTVRILYGTHTGTARGFAEMLQKKLFALNVAGYAFEPSVVDMKDYDQDNLEHEQVVISILSTWTHGVPPESAKLFCNWLQDMAQDFRVSKSWLKHVFVATYGLGNAEYDEHYCTAAKQLSKHFNALGATRLVKRGDGDDNQDQTAHFEQWSDQLVASLCEQYGALSAPKDAKEWVSQKEFRRQKRKEKAIAAGEHDEEVMITDEDRMNEIVLDDDDDETPAPKGDGVVDVEDLGVVMKESEAAALNREMVTPLQRKALTKEGYKIIGTHSAVKLCRWTKHQLRGRGGCYKHTFYGITSYQCMETTPSLACANKCVFCWRHHKNPVGREWRWKTDDPVELVEGAISRHQTMIKEVKGLPGLIQSRWEEAFTVKHCALSLVGEPIMYPHINAFCRELHARNISSFLVTNAQFPEKIAELEPITQLYVSVDAATKESLKAIDRPLFKDFWERFLSCLRQLKEKGQRTVYRMTLVKEHNMKEIDNYVELIEIGQPDLIEIKAVTYCGKSDASDLTMKNVPYHEEVRAFCELLCAKLGGAYGLATEHAHSNCVLLAKTQFKIDGHWHTWIDYDKFHALVQQFYKDGTPFSTMDYIAPTPHWAVYDAPEAGFDPIETRFRRTKEGKVVEIEYTATDSGCG
ncbi:tRNA wybutosine-synthesizing protein [Achlya hypogyna]|uniref:tRNA 4-demethylwyosine synthase (AdoMet-dependent) n=1 Tax=Achlya hypogyna TaxID=1202772 RepID=A0A1V9YLA3_ACHHY|nr:tRNA wybutosine-synthesizing protein [Achlya hypogyna]